MNRLRRWWTGGKLGPTGMPHGYGNLPSNGAFVVALLSMLFVLLSGVYALARPVGVSYFDVIDVNTCRGCTAGLGLVTSVSGSPPIASSGGTTPAISCPTCVTNVTGTAPIASSGGTTPAISLNNTAVTPGSYTNSSITVDAQGRLTAASSGSPTGLTSAKRTSTTTQSITNSTSTAVSFVTANGGSTVWDDASYYNNANPTRLTAPATGKYEALGEVCWATNQTGARAMWFSINGTNTVGAGQIEVPADSIIVDGICEATSTLLALNNGDYVELYVFQTASAGAAVALAASLGKSAAIQLLRVE